MRVHTVVRNFAEPASGCDGHWTSSVSKILLLEVIREAQHRDLGNGLHKPCLQDRRMSAKTSRRDQCLPSHQASSKQKLTLANRPGWRGPRNGGCGSTGHCQRWTIQPLTLDQQYINIKNQVIKSERRILKELGFCVHVKHPHKIIVMYLKFLEVLEMSQLMQRAWNYMNDIFRTDVFVRYTPETIAAACIHLAARSLKVPLPNNPSWFYVFHISEDDIQAVCLTLLRLYARPKPNYEKLGHEVEKAKKAVLDAKNKAKAKGLATELGTPNSSSRPGTPKNVSPNPSLVLGRRIKGEEDRMSEMGSEKNHVSKKRGRSIESDASKSGRSRSRSKSRSRSSRSHSFTPPSKKRHKSPFRKYRKDRYSPDKYASKDKHSRKKKHHSRSISRSPDRYLAKASKKYYKDKDYDRHPYSPERHRSRKHRNGHRNSPRDRYGRR